MSAFLSLLSVECIDDTNNDGRGIWKVTKPFLYHSDILGRIIIVEKGFLTDYASVPRYPFLYWWFGDTSHRAGVIHDWLFHNQHVCDEKTANKVLLEASKCAGIPWYIRIPIYIGVTLGSASSYEEDSRGNGHSVIDGRIV